MKTQNVITKENALFLFAYMYPLLIMLVIYIIVAIVYYAKGTAADKDIQACKQEVQAKINRISDSINDHVNSSVATAYAYVLASVTLSMLTLLYVIVRLIELTM
jgi:sensor domain CHASE-containing protein